MLCGYKHLCPGHLMERDEKKLFAAGAAGGSDGGGPEQRRGRDPRARTINFVGVVSSQKPDKPEKTDAPSEASEKPIEDEDEDNGL